VKTGNSGGKPPILRPSEFDVCWGQKMKMDCGKKVRMKHMSNVCTVRVCSLNSTTVQNCLNWVHYDCANCRKSHDVWQVQEMADNLRIVAAKFMKTWCRNINKYIFLFVASLFRSLQLSLRKPQYATTRGNTYWVLICVSS